MPEEAKRGVRMGMDMRFCEPRVFLPEPTVEAGLRIVSRPAFWSVPAVTSGGRRDTPELPQLGHELAWNAVVARDVMVMQPVSHQC